MNTQTLEATARMMVADGKGLLAIDESNGICNKRLVEPEVVMDGAHTMDVLAEVTERVLRAVFIELHARWVKLERVMLKPNMVLPGLDCSHQDTADKVPDATVACVLRCVPAAVTGVVFLSGGQPGELASPLLNAMNVRYSSRLPWQLLFSCDRAIQEPALEIWHSEVANVVPAQEALYYRARRDCVAQRGDYDAAAEAVHQSSAAHHVENGSYAGSAM